MVAAETDRVATIRSLFDVVASTQAVADELGLHAVVITLDMALAQLESAIEQLNSKS